MEGKRQDLSRAGAKAKVSHLKVTSYQVKLYPAPILDTRIDWYFQNLAAIMVYKRGRFSREGRQRQRWRREDSDSV